MKLLQALAVVASFVVSTAAFGQEPNPDKEAVILVANEDLRDPVYARTVLVAKPIGGRMHIGVILNKQTDRSLASLFPQHEPSKLVQENVYFGGPMSRSAVSALTRVTQQANEGVIEFASNLYFVLHVNTIDAIIEKTPNDARYYIGNVVWRPGELEFEMQRGLWNVLPVTNDIVLRKETRDLWRDLSGDSSLQRAQWRPRRLALAPVPSVF